MLSVLQARLVCHSHSDVEADRGSELGDCLHSLDDMPSMHADTELPDTEHTGDGTGSLYCVQCTAKTLDDDDLTGNSSL